MGVAIQNVDQALANSFGLDKPAGALIAQVTQGSPAAKGGLERGDIILNFNGKPVSYSSALPPLVGSVAPGKTVEVIVQRSGKQQTLNVTIEPLDEGRKVSSVTPADPVDESRLGVEVADITDDLREQMNIESGVVVTEISPDGPAAKAGIRVGDVILSLNREEIDSTSELEKLVKDAPEGQAVPVLVQRETSPIFLALTLPAANG